MIALEDPRAAVCGAGIAGLVLAIRMQQIGLRPVVFEAKAADAIENEGEFLTLAPNGMNGLRAVGCCEEVIASGIDTRGIELLNARGKSLAIADQRDHARTFGAPSITVRRSVLASILIRKAAALGIPIRFGSRVVQIDNRADGTSIRLEDGSRFDSALVAGADGLRSKVRKEVFPDYPDPHFTGVIGTGGTLEAEVPSTDGLMRMTFGDKAFFGYIKAGASPVYWFNSYSAAQAGSGLQPDPRQFAEFIRGLHDSDPFPNGKILGKIARLERSYPVFDMPSLPRWWKGRVVLLGDSAHAVGPHAGQGASMAIEDALVLAACLDSSRAISQAFQRYEKLRRGRVEKVVRLTSRNSSTKKRPSTWLGDRIRDLVLPIFVRIGIRSGRQLFSFRADVTPLTAPSL